MQSLCDDNHLITFAYLDQDKNEQIATLSPSEGTLQLHMDLRTALSEQKPDTEINAKRMEWMNSATRDAKAWVNELTAASKAAISAANTALPPTNTDSAQIHPTANSENPSLSEPDKPSSKND